MPKVAFDNDRDELEGLIELDGLEEDEVATPQYRREIFTIAVGGLALVLFMALFSYQPIDIAGRAIQGDEPPAPPQNWVGMPGAYLAFAAFSMVGWCAYLLPFPLILFVLLRWFPQLTKGWYADSAWPVYVGSAMVLLGGSAGLALIPMLWTVTSESPVLAWNAGGMLGYFLANRMLTLGPGGALVIELSVLSIGLLLATPMLFGWLWRRFRSFCGFRSQEEVLVHELEALDTAVIERNVMPDFDSSLPALRIIGEEDEDEPDEEDDDIFAEGLPSLNAANSDKGYKKKSTRNTAPADGTKREEISSLPPLKTAEELKIVTNDEQPEFDKDLNVNCIATPDNSSYELPSTTLLSLPQNSRPELAREEIVHNSGILEQTMKDFGIEVRVVEVNYGPTITCYELEPAPGIKISRIENLANDITRALRACSVRIVAPIPGKGTVGVEVPNRHRQPVLLRELLCSENYRKHESKLRIGLGKTISGEPYTFDLTTAPHLLVAGATGSGKSVCINTIITSFLYNAAPHEVKLLMVDPKQVELAVYRDIPHLLSPVVTDPRRAGAALRWAVEEMDQRYRYLKRAGVRNITEYNTKRSKQLAGKAESNGGTDILPGFLPYIVVIIDELADLMMVVRNEVESMIARLAAMARAVGIHLVLATQRPSVDVLTGVIKNNFPSRIAFQVSSMADSRTILDMKGAEALMGKGDMLISAGGAGRPIRLQGAYISTEEIESVVEFIKAQQEVHYVQEDFIPTDEEKPNSEFSDFDAGEDYDDLYDQAVQIVLENDSASTSLLQRRMKIGYGRAARLLDMMEEKGIVGPPRGSKPRQIILNRPV